MCVYFESLTFKCPQKCHLSETILVPRSNIVLESTKFILVNNGPQFIVLERTSLNSTVIIYYKIVLGLDEQVDRLNE